VLENLFRKKISEESMRMDFVQKILSLPQHMWILEDRYIKANILSFIELLPNHAIAYFMEKGELNLMLLPSCGRFGLALSAPKNRHFVVMFPELMQSLKSLSPERAWCMLAHELGHLYYRHSWKKMDPIEAQIEADAFAMDLGLAGELENFLLEQPESVEKRVRLSRLTARVLGGNSGEV